MATSTTTSWRSRAVLRTIEAGTSATCVGCDEPVKFRAKSKAQQVICNVYVDGRWDRVEHFHSECYSESGDPHGEPAQGVPTKAAALVAAAAAAAEAAASPVATTTAA